MTSNKQVCKRDVIWTPIVLHSRQPAFLEHSPPSGLHSRKALHTVQHHHAHAVYAFLDSPFRSALVLTIDGGGGPLAFGIWKGTRKPFGVTRLAAPCPYLGIAWIRFVSHKSLTLLRDLQCTQKHCNWGPVSAAFMDLGTLGTVRLQWLQSMMRVAQLCPYHGVFLFVRVAACVRLRARRGRISGHANLKRLRNMTHEGH